MRRRITYFLDNVCKIINKIKFTLPASCFISVFYDFVNVIAKFLIKLHH